MNKKMLDGLYHAPKDKRYKSFAVQAADTEAVWVLDGDADKGGVWQEDVYVWPMKEFAEMYCSAAVVEMDVHDFMEDCRKRLAREDFIIHVFPNDVDSCDIYASELLERLQEELDLIE